MNIMRPHCYSLIVLKNVDTETDYFYSMFSLTHVHIALQTCSYIIDVHEHVITVIFCCEFTIVFVHAYASQQETLNWNFTFINGKFVKLKFWLSSDRSKFIMGL